MRHIKILFICHGNICRSPMAEFVLKALVANAENTDEIGTFCDFEIDSAAVSTEEIGNDIYPPAQRKLREKGIPFTHRAARQITRADYAYYDLIVCADRSNLRWLERIVGEDTEHKISLLMQWAGEPSTDVADPWYTGDFEEAYNDIERGCKGLLKSLK